MDPKTLPLDPPMAAQDVTKNPETVGKRGKMGQALAGTSGQPVWVHFGVVLGPVLVVLGLRFVQIPM